MTADVPSDSTPQVDPPKKRPLSRPKDELEVGVVYSRGDSRFIALHLVIQGVEKVCLVTRRAKTFRITRAKSAKGYEPLRSISISDLCSYWRVSVAVFDEFYDQHRIRPQHPMSVGGRIRRRRDEYEETALRTHRFLRDMSMRSVS